MAMECAIGMVLGAIIGVPIGLIGHFISVYIEKRNFRWAWLLCKPNVLTDEEMDELSRFY